MALHRNTVSLIAVLALTIIGGSMAAYVLAPGPIELSAMKARENEFRAAKDSYEALLKERGPKRDIVMPLADIYESLGEEEAAWRALSDYARLHPDDIQALQRYANFLGDTQRVKDQVAVLAIIAHKTNDVNTWRTLSTLYRFYGPPEKETEALQKLSDAGAASFDELIELSELHAAAGELKKALAASEKALEANPERFDLAAAETHIALSLAAKERGRASAALDAWSARQKNRAAIISFAQGLEGMGSPDLALRLLQRSPFYATDNTIRLEAIRLSSVSGDPSKSFEALKPWAAAGKLDTSGTALLVDLGFTLGRYEEVFAAFGPGRLAKAPPGTQLGLVDVAAETGRTALLNRWRQEAGPDWRRLAPVAAARLALALNQPGEASRLAREAVSSAKTDADRANAARALAESGAKAEALSIVEALGKKHGAGGLSADALYPLTEAALNVGRADIAVAAARDISGASPQPADAALYARALTASGQSLRAIAILSPFDARDPAVEASLLSALRAADERPRLHTLLFTRLTDPTLPRGRRNTLLSILVESAPLGAEAAKLSPLLLRDLKTQGLSPQEQRLRVRALALSDPKAAAPYAESLANSALTDDVVLYADLMKRSGRGAEAIRALSAAAARAKTKDEKGAFVSVLLRLGGTEAALPLLADLAKREGGDWRYAYEDALEKLGRRDALAEALKLRADDEKTPQNDRRDLAQALLAMGRKAEAETLMRQLASGQSPDSADVNNLFFLWGPRPEPEAIAWVVAEARRAPASHKAGWLNRLLDAGAPKEVSALGSELLAKGIDPGVLDATVRAYAALKDETSLTRVLLPIVPSITDAAAAGRFAQAASDAGASRAAGLLFQRAYELDPRRFEDLGRAGLAAYYDGDQAKAKPMLNIYAERGGQLPEARFALAELDFRANAFGKARTGYDLVIAAADAQPKNTVLGRLKALALLRLKRNGEALATYRALLAMAPNDPQIRADAGEALLDDGQVEEAAAVLKAE